MLNWLTSPIELSKPMIANKTTYFISVHKKSNISEYFPVKTTENVTVYERNS